jgi:hypothetical protein
LLPSKEANLMPFCLKARVTTTEVSWCISIGRSGQLTVETVGPVREDDVPRLRLASSVVQQMLDEEVDLPCQP